MTLTFPVSPAVGDEHQENGNSWVWNAKSVWERGVGPEPVLISLVPDNAYVTLDLDKLIDINGTGFQLNSRIFYDNVALVGGYVSGTLMRMTVNGVNELTPRDAPVRVDQSNELPFHFLPRPPDSPNVLSVMPNIVWTMNPAATMRILGTGFETISTVMLQAPNNGAVTAQVTTFVSATELTIWFDGPNTQTGVWNVYVNTPGADAPDSNKVTVTVSA